MSWTSTARVTPALDQLLGGQVGGGTAGAASLQLETDDALVKPDDFQLTAVAVEGGPDILVQCGLDL